MSRIPAVLLVVAGCLGVVPSARAQHSDASAQAGPRVEVGAGGGVFFSGGTMPFTDGLFQVHGGGAELGTAFAIND